MLSPNLHRIYYIMSFLKDTMKHFLKFPKKHCRKHNFTETYFKDSTTQKIFSAFDKLPYPNEQQKSETS